MTSSTHNPKPVPPEDTKARSFVGSKPHSFEYLWWIMYGTTLRDVWIYYGWGEPHSFGVAALAGLTTMGIFYALRWTFAQ